MQTVDVIRAVRDGQELPAEALQALVVGASSGEVPDYQLSAFLMAVFHRGLSVEATATLTAAMRDSGSVLALEDVVGRKIDKHSTGGVGDKVSLCLAPWVAACGVNVPMISGRGLGHTGGTLDKLASMPGFSHALTPAQFVALLARNGVAMMGQSAAIAPADGKLYALRDVTATVESLPLITASILAKKLAAGIDALVLDVKVGRGAFMQTLDEARALAASIIGVGASLGLEVRAVLSAMDAPLGCAIGNALEVREAIAVLEGTGPRDVTELTLTLGAHMLELGEVVGSLAEGRAKMLAARTSGAAWQSFCRMVAAQGGDVAALSDGGRGLPAAPLQTTLHAEHTGNIAAIDGYALGHAANELGAGRLQVDDEVDPAVGLVLERTVGEAIGAKEPWLTVHHRKPLSPVLRGRLEAALTVSAAAPRQSPLVIETLDAQGLAGQAPAP